VFVIVVELIYSSKASSPQKGVPREAMSVATPTEMSKQTVEVKFQGEQVGSYTDNNTTYTLYSVLGDLYVVHVDKGDESWLETNGGQGLSEAMLGTFFPQLAEACDVERVLPHDKAD
jgi:hypothetical protein